MMKTTMNNHNRWDVIDKRFNSITNDSFLDEFNPARDIIIMIVTVAAGINGETIVSIVKSPRMLELKLIERYTNNNE